jgi:hypothetical protein
MLNALIIVGALISFLNLGDWLLRPHQKEAFQRFMESLTLTLDYTRPMIWFARLGERRFAVAWTIICALYVFFSGVLSVAFSGSDMTFRIAFSVDSLLGGAIATLVDFWRNALLAQARILIPLGADHRDLAVTLVYAFVVINLLTILTTFWLIGSRVTRFLASEGRISIFIVRLLVMYAITAVFAFALMNGAIYFGKSIWYAIIGIPGLLILPVPIAVVAIGMLMVTLTLLLLLLELFLKVSRAICWRVVEYSKGAWAAVIAVLTAALGIYKALLS